MKKHLRLLLFLFSISLLTACPAPEYNHVIVNESKAILEVEYEYFAGGFKEDRSEIANPAKINFEQYENDAQNNQWSNLTTENQYELKANGEETTNDSISNQQKKREIKLVKLKLLPGEVLRVFISGHINYDLKNLKRINLRGADGTLEITGTGIEQFSRYRPDGFFADTKDYRIVYR